MREFYFTQEHEAVLVLECSSIDDGYALLEQLPLVNHHLIRFEVMELRPYTGFSRIINGS